MNRRCYRMIVLLFAGLLAMQTASGHLVLCLCESGRAAAEVPQDPLGCCSAEDFSPGGLAMETPDAGGCEDCVKVPLCSNDLRERQLSSARSAIASVAQAEPFHPGACSGDLQHLSLGMRPGALSPPSTVIRI